MDTVEKFDGPARFVRLQVSHQMPARRGPSDFYYFLLGFLHSILAEVCDTYVQSVSQRVYWVRLADCDKSDLLRCAIRAARGGFNAVANVRKSFAQSLKCEWFLCHHLRARRLAIESK